MNLFLYDSDTRRLKNGHFTQNAQRTASERPRSDCDSRVVDWSSSVSGTMSHGTAAISSITPPARNQIGPNPPRDPCFATSGYWKLMYNWHSWLECGTSELNLCWYSVEVIKEHTMPRKLFGSRLSSTFNQKS